MKHPPLTSRQSRGESEFGIITENFVSKTLTNFPRPRTLIYNSCSCLSFTFNQPFNLSSILPTIVYINPCVSANKSVLNWTQVCWLLRYSSWNPFTWKEVYHFNIFLFMSRYYYLSTKKVKNIFKTRWTTVSRLFDITFLTWSQS